MMIWRRSAEFLKSKNLKTLSPLIVASTILLVLAINIIVHNLQFYSSVTTTDLGQDYHAASALRAGNSIYDGINHHVPFVAVLSTPLTFMEFRTAFILWGALSIVLLFVCIFIVARGLELKLGLWWLILPGMMLSWYPFVAHVALGQWSLIIATLIFGAWLAMKKGKDNSAGLLLGVAAAIKLFPGIFGLYLLVQRRWRALAFMMLAFSSCTLVSLAVVGFNDFRAFIYSDILSNSSNFVRYPLNHSLWGMTYRLFTSNGYVAPLIDAPAIAHAVTTLLCLMICGVLFLGTRRTVNEHAKDIAYSATAVAMLIISPLTWQHALVILVLPFGILFVLSNAINSPKMRIAIICFFIMTSIHDVQFSQMIVNMSNKYSPQWYWGMALLGPLTTMVIIFAIFTRQLVNHKAYKLQTTPIVPLLFGPKAENETYSDPRSNCEGDKTIGGHPGAIQRKMNDESAE